MIDKEIEKEWNKTVWLAFSCGIEIGLVVTLCLINIISL